MSKDIKVTITKSEIPIIWLDTSIITVMTQWKYKLCRIDSIKKERISKLYDAIYDNTQIGKLICPLAEQEAEVWVERDKWLDTINTLSLGIRTVALKDIQDNQLYVFMKAFLENDHEVVMNYKDAFYSDPAKELRKTLKSKLPVFVTVNMPILFGKDYQKNLKNNIHQSLNIQREKNVKSKISFEDQIIKEYFGELEAMFKLREKFLLGQFENEHDKFNVECGVMNLHDQLDMWESLSGNSLDYNGLIDFYGSSHHRAMPYTNLSCNLFARLMTDKQPIRSGDVMDIKHISTLMPFSNIFITDKAMSTFLRRKKFDKLYNTIVCYVGDSQLIDDFFSNL